VLGALGFWFILTKQSEENSATPVNGEKVAAAATIFPLFDILRNVGGEYVDARLILPPGASPHLFSFSPSDIAKLEGTEVIFAVGHGLDNWLSGAVADDYAHVAVVPVDDQITLRSIAYHGHEDDHEEDDHEGEQEEVVDPHYWLDVNNAIQITRNISAYLQSIDPENARAYRANTEAYIVKLKNLDTEIISKVNGHDETVITLHDAWGYFADYVGIEISGTFEPAAGEQPSPQYLEQLQEVVAEHGVRTIWSEPQLDTTTIEPFVADLSLDIVTIDPIGGIEGTESYIDLMQFNANAIVQSP